MFIRKRNFDKYGNFDNKIFLELIKKSQKALIKKKRNKNSAINMEISLFNSISKKEIWKFINKLSTFLNSGIDIKGALIITSKQTKNKFLSKVIKELRVNIDYGILISESMMQYPKIFDNLTIALIGVGEKTGNLGKILNELDKKMLENIELKAKVKGALIYPAILLVLTFSMVTFMMLFIIPKIRAGFSKTGSELPYLTQLIINISNFFRNEWLIIFGGIFIFITFIKLFSKTHIGELSLGYISINLPIFGYVIRQSNIIYFINSFSLLMESGVLLLDALKTSSGVVPNIHYKKEVVRVKNEVESGLTISKSLGLNLEYETNIYTNKLFPEEFAYIINTGEETGTLSESIKKLGRNYSYELKRYIGNMAAMMEPIIIVIVGFLIGIIVVAIMLPFFQLGEIAKKM